MRQPVAPLPSWQGLWLPGMGCGSAPQHFAAELCPGTGTGEVCRGLSSERKPRGSWKYGLSAERLLLFWGWLFPPGDPDFADRVVATRCLQALVWSLFEKQLGQKLGCMQSVFLFRC